MSALSEEVSVIGKLVISMPSRSSVLSIEYCVGADLASALSEECSLLIVFCNACAIGVNILRNPPGGRGGCGVPEEDEPVPLGQQHFRIPI